MSLIEFLLDLILCVWTPPEPFPDPERAVGCLVLLGLILLLAVGVGAILYSLA